MFGQTKLNTENKSLCLKFLHVVLVSQANGFYFFFLGLFQILIYFSAFLSLFQWNMLYFLLDSYQLKFGCTIFMYCLDFQKEGLLLYYPALSFSNKLNFLWFFMQITQLIVQNAYRIPSNLVLLIITANETYFLSCQHGYCFKNFPFSSNSLRLGSNFPLILVWSIYFELHKNK